MENSGSAHQLLTAREAGLVNCRTCGRVSPGSLTMCGRCGAALRSRDTKSLQKVWAWWIAGVIAYIPANTYPMLITSALGKESGSTLIGGVFELIHHGAVAIAGVVFFASVCIPIAKFVAVAFLALSVQRRGKTTSHQRHLVYEVVEFVGRWSMIDVFVVAILTALVQLGSAVSIHPGIAAISFALSVAFTMLSALSFDPRLIWDADKDQPK